MPVCIRLPASVGDDPRLVEHPVYRRPVPGDVPAYVERHAPGACPECVVFTWPDGAEAVWDSDFGFSVPRVPPGPPGLPATIEEAEAEYRIEVACGVPEAEARRRLKAHVERIHAKAAERTQAEPECSHSPDFTSVVWFGTRYSFGKGNQAEAVRVLWEAWENGGHSLSQELIGERTGSAAARFELRKVFRSRKPDGSYEPHPAWGTMIVPDGKGCYRLAPPPDPAT